MSVTVVVVVGVANSPSNAAAPPPLLRRLLGIGPYDGSLKAGQRDKVQFRCRRGCCDSIVGPRRRWRWRSTPEDQLAVFADRRDIGAAGCPCNTCGRHAEREQAGKVTYEAAVRGGTRLHAIAAQHHTSSRHTCARRAPGSFQFWPCGCSKF